MLCKRCHGFTSGFFVVTSTAGSLTASFKSAALKRFGLFGDNIETLASGRSSLIHDAIISRLKFFFLFTNLFAIERRAAI
jgi:hypothetical protein